jgi:hypothetical protein
MLKRLSAPARADPTGRFAQDGLITVDLQLIELRCKHDGDICPKLRNLSAVIRSFRFNHRLFLARAVSLKAIMRALDEKSQLSVSQDEHGLPLNPSFQPRRQR